jgi:hypothetical protein
VATAQAANDGLDIFVADSAKRTGVHLVLRRGGEATATFGTVETSRKTDPSWEGPWQSAIRETADGWMAEVALPINTLLESGMDPDRLQLNGMAQSWTASGHQTVFLTDPRYGTKFQSCVGFRRMAALPAERPQPRSFTVRLHFAEVGDLSPGQRVFDVAIQGKTVLENLDVVDQAGGKNRALVKEFQGVVASDQIVIELTPGGQPKGGSPPPLICGVEVVQEEPSNIP